MIDDACHTAQVEAIYLEAEAKFQQSIALGNQEADYNLACLYSLMGKYEESVHYLERAKGNESLPAMEDLLHDEWLESLRQTPNFRNFLAQYNRSQEPGVGSQ